MRNHRPQPHSTEALGIGERLRNAREAKGLSLSALEAITRIRGVYLQALEEEQFDHLPGRVYARGFLRTYAKALGLDPDELAHAYPQAFDLAAEPILGSYPVEVPIRPAVPPSRLRRILIYAGAVVFLAVVVLVVIGIQQMRQLNAPVPEVQTPPPPAPAPQAAAPQRPPETAPARPAPEASPTVVPPETPAVSAPAPQTLLPPPPPPEKGLEVVIQARGTSWLRILADGQQVFQGMIQEGDVRTWRANSELTVRVGRPSVVTVYVNGQPVATRLRPGRQVWEETFKTQ